MHTSLYRILLLPAVLSTLLLVTSFAHTMAVFLADGVIPVQ